MQIIFRDDDTSYYTTPELLETVYAPLWEHNVPVCLSVIPFHHANIVIDTPGRPAFIDPNIHPAYRGQDKAYPVSENRELCAYLNEKVKQGLVEICLHGYQHRWAEWHETDQPTLKRWLEEGKRELEKTFPDSAIDTFIIPYDMVSDAALNTIIDAGFHTSVSVYNIPTTSKLKGSPANRVLTQPNNTKFFTGGHEAFDRDMDEWLAVKNHQDAVLVCLNHYYMFYDDFDQRNEALFDKWHTALKHLLPQYTAQVTTFNNAQA